MLEAHPAVGRDLVANIPRLEEVAQIIAYQQKRFDGSGVPSGSVSGKQIPLGARILKVALDYDTLKWSGLTDVDVLVELRQRPGWYDPEILAVMEAIVGFEESFEVQKVAVKDLTTQMTLAEDVTTTEGALVVSKGQEVTPSLRQRLKNFARNRNLAEPIKVLVRAKAGSRPVQHAAQS